MKIKEVFDCPVISVVVVDGDTQKIVLDRGWRTTQGVTTRINGIDTPEIGTEAGRLVAKIVEYWLRFTVQTQYRLRWLSYELDMYGRSVGDFVDREHPAESLGQYLIRMQLAKALDGRTARSRWTDNELTDVTQLARAALEK